MAMIVDENRTFLQMKKYYDFRTITKISKQLLRYYGSRAQLSQNKNTINEDEIIGEKNAILDKATTTSNKNQLMNDFFQKRQNSDFFGFQGNKSNNKQGCLNKILSFLTCKTKKQTNSSNTQENDDKYPLKEQASIFEKWKSFNNKSQRKKTKSRFMTEINRNIEIQKVFFEKNVKPRELVYDTDSLPQLEKDPINTSFLEKKLLYSKSFIEIEECQDEFNLQNHTKKNKGNIKSSSTKESSLIKKADGMSYRIWLKENYGDSSLDFFDDILKVIRLYIVNKSKGSKMNILDEFFELQRQYSLSQWIEQKIKMQSSISQIKTNKRATPNNKPSKILQKSNSNSTSDFNKQKTYRPEANSIYNLPTIPEKKSNFKTPTKSTMNTGFNTPINPSINPSRAVSRNASRRNSDIKVIDENEMQTENELPNEQSEMPEIDFEYAFQGNFHACINCMYDTQFDQKPMLERTLLYMTMDLPEKIMYMQFLDQNININKLYHKLLVRECSKSSVAYVLSCLDDLENTYIENANQGLSQAAANAERKILTKIKRNVNGTYVYPEKKDQMDFMKKKLTEVVQYKKALRKEVYAMRLKFFNNINI